MVEIVNDTTGFKRAIIRSEDDAWALLQLAITQEPSEEVILPRFEGWPSANFRFWVDEQNNVLTSPIMNGLLSYQSSLYRSFMLVQEGTTNLRRLNIEQRREFEVHFHVSPGSTKIDIDLTAIAEKFVIEALSIMNGTQLTIIAISAILAWVSRAAWKDWLEKRKSDAIAEATNDTVKEILAAQQFAQKADIEKTEMLIGAIEKAMDTRALWEVSEEGKEGILRAAANVSNADVMGISLPPAIAKKLARKTRATPEQDYIEGEFSIIRVDANYADGFRVKLKHQETDIEFFAGVRDKMLAPDHIEILSSAEWQKKPVIARVRVTRHRGEITEAEIVSVESRKDKD